MSCASVCVERLISLLIESTHHCFTSCTLVHKLYKYVTTLNTSQAVRTYRGGLDISLWTPRYYVLLLSMMPSRAAISALNEECACRHRVSLVAIGGRSTVTMLLNKHWYLIGFRVLAADPRRLNSREWASTRVDLKKKRCWDTGRNVETRTCQSDNRIYYVYTVNCAYIDVSLPN